MHSLLFPKIYIEATDTRIASFMSKYLADVMNIYSRLGTGAYYPNIDYTPHPKIEVVNIDIDSLTDEIIKDEPNFKKISEICHFNNRQMEIVGVGPLTVLTDILWCHMDKLCDKDYSNRLLPSCIGNNNAISLEKFYQQLGIEIDERAPISSILIGLENNQSGDMLSILSRFTKQEFTRQKSSFIYAKNININVDISHPFNIMHIRKLPCFEHSTQPTRNEAVMKNVGLSMWAAERILDLSVVTYASKDGGNEPAI